MPETMLGGYARRWWSRWMSVCMHVLYVYWEYVFRFCECQPHLRDLCLHVDVNILLCLFYSPLIKARFFISSSLLCSSCFCIQHRSASMHSAAPQQLQLCQTVVLLIAAIVNTTTTTTKKLQTQKKLIVIIREEHDEH